MMSDRELSEYAKINHARWLEQQGYELSSLGRKVAQVLGVTGSGLYNAPIKPKEIQWDNPYRIEVIWGRYLTNWDGSDLTALWAWSGALMLRVTINPHAFRYLKLEFWERRSREGRISVRLPNLPDQIRAVGCGEQVDSPDLVVAALKRTHPGLLAAIREVIGTKIVDPDNPTDADLAALELALQYTAGIEGVGDG